MTIVPVTYAPHAFKMLNGVFCAYKPLGMHYKKFRTLLIDKLAAELNEMEVRPPHKRVEIVGSFSENKFEVQERDSYSDMPAVVGPRYSHNDFSMKFAHNPPTFGSGVTVIGISQYGSFLANELYRANYLRVYELKCTFGISTDTGLTSGRIVEKSTHRHVRKERLDLVLNRIQSGHQRQMYQALNIDLTSQAAYEMAAKGLIRPEDRSTAPIIYGLRCVHLAMPEFTIEMYVINEDYEYILSLVNDIGLKCKTNACLRSVRCTRYGNFTVDDCLLEKHCTVENVINNIRMCSPLVSEDKLFPSENLKPIEQHQQSFLEVLKEKESITKELQKRRGI